MKHVFRFLIILTIAGFLAQCTVEKTYYVPQKGPYLQGVKNDGITVIWESKNPYKGVINYGKTEELGITQEETDSTRLHKIVLTGLDIENVYYYRVKSEKNIESEIHSFKTAVKPSSPFSFAAYGDSKNGPFNHQKIADLILQYQPNLVFHNGDLVDRGSEAKQWQRLFFDPIKNLIHDIPVYPTMGNHEDDDQQYYNYFNLPSKKAYFSFDYGNAHFIILNTDYHYLYEGSDQLKWLVEDLEKNTADWTFAFHHIPLFTSGGNYYSRSRINVKNTLFPIYDKYGVDMSFAGHDHHYERTKPIGSKGGDHLATFIVGGNGGTPMRYIGKPKEFSLTSTRTFGFSLIELDDTKLRFKEISIDNTVLDEFVLNKSDPASVADYKKDKINFEDIHDPVQASKLYSKGKKLFKKKMYTKAVENLLESYRIDNECEEATAMLAECFYKLGDYVKARKFADITIANAPLHPDSYEVIASIYEKQKKYDEAIKWYEKMYNVTMDSPDAMVNIAELLYRQGKLDRAIKKMNEAIKILPNDAELYFDLGEMLEKTGQMEKALQVYKIGIDWYMKPEIDDEYREILQKIKALEKN